MYLVHTLMHYTRVHYKSNPIVLAVSSIYSQIPHTLCFFLYCDPRVFPKAKIPHVEITKLRHSIYSSNSVFFFVIIQKQKLSISSLSELVKKAESPKILLLNFFREIIFTKKLLSRKIQFFFTVIIIKCMYILLHVTRISSSSSSSISSSSISS